MKLMKETVNAREITRVHDEEYHYSCGYYSNNVWFSENQIVLSRAKELLFENGCQLMLFDLESGQETLLVEHCNGYLDYVVHGEKLYYVSGNTLYCLNVATGETATICESEGMHFPHMTKDGRYMNWETSPDRKCMWLDLETGELKVAFRKRFADPFSSSNHYMLCPTDPTKIFFAHEGDTRYISNRLWLWEEDKGMRCIAKQRLDEDGNVGDCFGHECWAPDGKGLWFVKYRESTISPKGLSYVDMEGNQKVAIYGKYPYWHVSCSADGRYLGADAIIGHYEGPQMKTAEEVDMSRVIECDCCVVDLQTGEEESVVKVLSNSVHPCHPHPAFSPNSKWLCFHDFAEGQVMVGFAKLA